MTLTWQLALVVFLFYLVISNRPGSRPAAPGECPWCGAPTMKTIAPENNGIQIETCVHCDWWRPLL